MDPISLLRNAYHLAEEKSDDPLTKNGAIIVNSQNNIIGLGANQLPDGVKRDPARFERPLKYEYFIHAEQNAIAHAARQGHATEHATMYCPWAACTFCARLIIQSGIKKVITHKNLMDQTHMKWPQEIDRSKSMFKEAGIEFIELSTTIGGVVHIFNGNTWNP